MMSINLVLVFVGGVLGSSHCVGMCGGFALALGSGAPGVWSNLRRQAVYSVGRMFTYAVCGAMAGFAGLWLTRQLPALVDAQAVLAVVAGLLLVFQGLSSAGLLPRWSRDPARNRAAQAACLGGGLLANFLRRGGWTSVFVAGMLTGLLPCGLVYAFLALASSTSDWLLGMAVMVAFGLGTVPLMVLTGVGGQLLGLSARRHVFQVAAWCVIVAGTLSIVRGASAFARPDQAAPPACPLCASPDVESPPVEPR